MFIFSLAAYAAQAYVGMICPYVCTSVNFSSLSL